jgi:hypothetical protein
MSDHRNESPPDLTDGFSKLRARREEAAGTYMGTVVSARNRERTRRAQTRRRIVFVLALLVPAAGVLTMQARTRARLRADLAAAEQAAAILQWRSPTETLMHNAYAEWLSAPPSLGSSVILPTLPQGGSQ